MRPPEVDSSSEASKLPSLAADKHGVVGPPEADSSTELSELPSRGADKRSIMAQPGVEISPESSELPSKSKRDRLKKNRSGDGGHGTCFTDGASTTDRASAKGSLFGQPLDVSSPPSVLAWTHMKGCRRQRSEEKNHVTETTAKNALLADNEKAAAVKAVGYRAATNKELMPYHYSFPPPGGARVEGQVASASIAASESLAMRSNVAMRDNNRQAGETRAGHTVMYQPAKKSKPRMWYVNV